MTRSTDLTTKLSMTVATIVVALYGALFVANSFGVNLIG